MADVLDLGCLVLQLFGFLFIIYYIVSRSKRKIQLNLEPASNLKSSKNCAAVQVQIVERKYFLFSRPYYLTLFEFFNSSVSDFSENFKGLQARANGSSEFELI